MKRSMVLVIALVVLLAGAVAAYAWQSNQNIDNDNKPANQTGKSTDTSEQSKAKPVTEAKTTSLNIYYIAIEDNGQTGQKIGCGDSVVSVQTEPITYQDKLKAAMEKLLADHNRNYGQSGLYNALYSSDLHYQSGGADGGTVRVNLSGELSLGGECDNPRVKAQLEQTALSASGAASADITLNGQPLDEVLSLR